ncbi:MAG: hypothetical protein JWP11_2934 [Frankiales bacterium]|nr:hypothetical protein [Frankiales bacterium]
MILDEKSRRWESEVLELAVREGWTPYVQSLRNRRQPMPSVVLVNLGRVLVVYLRLNRRNPPPIDDVAATLGVKAVLWTPADRPLVRAALGLPS